MNESLISKRYAKALFAYAREKGEEEALYDGMNTLVRNYAALPRLARTLDNPMVNAQEKEQLITCAGGGDTDKSYRAFTRLVVANRREGLIRNIALAYMKLYREIHNISVITLTSSKPLPETVYERITRQVENETHGRAEIEVVTDESIDGGFILQIDDLRLDASVRGQLERIRRLLTGRGKK